MYEGRPRDGAETEYRRRDGRAPMRRPDRIALWAVGIAVVGMIAAAASAHGAVGAPKHLTHTDDIHAAPIKK
jgi:fatty acid desaturase